MDLVKMVLDKMPKEVARTQVIENRKQIKIQYIAHWRAWNTYVLIFGTSQSHERLEERSGFGEEELDAFYPEWRNYIVD